MKNKIYILDLLWIFIGYLGAISLLLLVLERYSPLISVIISSILILVTVLFLRKRIEVKDQRFSWIFLLILLIALGLRIGPWIYLEGGQDQGVYVMMSKQYEINGKHEFNDITLPYLSEETKQKYVEQENWKVGGTKRIADTGEIYSDFYPLNPIFLSISGFLFGDQNRAYSLTIFSLLSIIGVYLLTYELSRKKWVGYISAGILTLMPIHIYFSRFPVSEILMLAFVLNALYYILHAYKSNNYSYLFLSLIPINLYLYLKLTWVVALPFCILTALVAMVYIQKRRREWLIWISLLLGCYLLSLLYYDSQITFIYTYFYRAIYKYIPEYIYLTFIITTPLLLFGISKYAQKYIKLVLGFVYRFRIPLIIVLAVLIMLYTAKTFYTMAFTTKYLGTYFDYFWGMANVGWYTLKDQVLVSIILHTSPFIAIALVLMIKKVNTVEKALLMVLLLTFIGFNIVRIKYTPYQIYYARYQLSEIIPICVIFFSLFIADLYEKRKILFSLLLFSVLAYNLLFTAYQYQGYVGTKYSFFESLRKDISTEDFVIFYNPTDWTNNFVYAPLKYFFQYPGIQTKSLNDVEIFSADVSKKADVYILSTQTLEGSKYQYIDRYRYERGHYANANEARPPLDWVVNDNTLPFCTKIIPQKYCGGLIPIKYHKGSIDLLLYKYSN